ncbi:5-hydroxytryptamine receptor 1D isoform X1 [Hydra vulgaris]|uniref:5-hydroxytryptamine receptor 1D isoform X1 n=1 Tax=Hydra vulgaris TaxID=6087 RepID=UPI001F5EFD7E|nr:5-hydroxytryptamine receptor 1D-like [Hydra vulgaris]
MAFIDQSKAKDSVSIMGIKSSYLSACFLISVVSNTMVIIAILKTRKLQTASNLFVLNLAVSDLLFTICGIPTIIMTTIAKKWLLGEFVCDAVGFLNSLFCTTSIWTLVMISINRYFNVAKAKNVKTMYTQRRVLIINAAVWMFSVFSSIPPLLGWGEFKAGTNFCTINGKKSISYSFFLGLIVYLVPFIFLSGLYTCIFFILHRHQKNKKKNKISVTSETTSANDIELDLNTSILQMPVRFTAHTIHDYFREFFTQKRCCVAPVAIIKMDHIKRKVGARCSTKQLDKTLVRVIKNYVKEVRLTKVMMLLVISFFVCWTPAVIGMLFYSLNIKCKNFDTVTFGIMCACLNVVLNPIIYAVLNSRLRKRMVEMLKIFLFFSAQKIR